MVREQPIPAELLGGDYQNDAAFRERVQTWINGLWARKDRTIAGLLAPDRKEIARSENHAFRQRR